MAIEDVRNHIKSSEEFGSDDIIIFADIDEMLSRKVLNSLKHCELRHGVLSGAIIMPMGNLDLAFRLLKRTLTLILVHYNIVISSNVENCRSDFPVPGKPHSFGRPTIIQMQMFLNGERSGRGVPDQFYVNGGNKFVNVL